MAREQTVLRAVDHLQETHDAWVASPENVLTEAYEDAVVNLIEICQTGDIPENCRKLISAVDVLATQWDEYGRTVSQEKPHPSQSFWAAVNAVFDSRKVATPIPRPPIESVKELARQGVNPLQIARIYSSGPYGEENGPFFTNGQPLLHLVQKELDEPGSVIGADFVHPAEVARLAKAAQVEEKQVRRLARKTSPVVSECPESIEELLLQHVPVKQIVSMKGCSVDAVAAEATRLNMTVELPTGGQAAAPVVDDEPDEPTNDVADQAIWDAIDGGLSVRDAAAMLDIHTNTVHAAMKRRPKVSA